MAEVFSAALATSLAAIVLSKMHLSLPGTTFGPLAISHGAAKAETNTVMAAMGLADPGATVSLSKHKYQPYRHLSSILQQLPALLSVLPQHDK